MIEPTTKERLVVLDVLRGVAILGILLANITSFAMPANYQFAPELPARSMAETWFDSLTLAFVNGKFRSMLAVLFGVGIWLQFQKRSRAVAEGRADGKAWPRGYLKRLLWLLVFGLIHGYGIWWGDILGMYALTAMLATLLVRCEGKSMAWLIGLLAANAFVTAVAMVPVMMFLYAGPNAKEYDLGSVWPLFSPTHEAIAYQTGSYLDQLQYRALWYTISLTMVPILGPIMLPLFLLGIVFGRAGVLQAPSKHPQARKWCLIAGFGVGLPLNLLGLVPMAPKMKEALQGGFEMFCGPLLALGYLMGIAMLVEAGALRWLTAALAKVGRVALSAYLLQSLACTFVFYSWGLGLFGKLGPAGWLTVVGAVWLLDLAFAYVWLRFFSMGPFEWLWRSLTESRRLPIRRRAEATA